MIHDDTVGSNQDSFVIMLLRRVQVFILVLLMVTSIYHLFKDSPTVVPQTLATPPLPPLRPVVHMKPLHVVVGPPTRYEHDLTALYAFAPITSDSYSSGAYRRRSSSRHS